MAKKVAVWENRATVTAKFEKILPGVIDRVAKVQLDGAKLIADTAKGWAPTATGRYRASLRGDTLANNPGKGRRSPVASQTTDPNATGVYGNYIWRFLEFGTQHMPAQPHIQPAYRAKRPGIKRRMASAVNRAVRKAIKGAG